MQIKLNDLLVISQKLTSIIQISGGKPLVETGFKAIFSTHSWIASVMWGTTFKEKCGN